MNETEIYKQHREVQNKYNYFLLAVAAAAIALSLKRTTDSKIVYSMIPLALAVLSWGLSFFCGCRRSIYAEVNLYANFELLKTQKGEHPKVGNNPQMIAAGAQAIKDAMEYNDNKAKFYGKWQFRLLILGALFFISWHIIEMIKLTISSGG